MIWHSSSSEEVLKELQVDDKEGLANGIADMRLEDSGQNVISRIERPKFSSYFLAQMKSKLVISLLVIAVVAFIVSLMQDTVNLYSPLLIVAIVVINAFISAYHLFSCNNTLDSIKQTTNPTVTVLRDGILKSVNAANLVTGDIILLEEGDYIPADARLIEANEFRCNETVLTGVEVPVEKNPDEIFEEITTLEKRSNMVFSGCSVVHGTAKAVVVATGLNTEIGRTSALLQQTGEDRLPLQNQLEGIGKIVNIAILVVCAVVFLISMIQNFNSSQFAVMTVNNFMNSVALAVAAIPEGLPAITTIVIAIG
ncbi:MAG: HAD-IC family P-type ATPase, partial [Acutalibacteraceae bacterium]|nr:HAD-IC family P-type ATPase [Acutalibacteraceae bacterium]